jgi:hypothetical protein
MDVFTFDWLCHAFKLVGLEDLNSSKNDLLSGSTPTWIRTMALDPTFGNFTSLELVFFVKAFRLFRSEQICLVFRV